MSEKPPLHGGKAPPGGLGPLPRSQVAIVAALASAMVSSLVWEFLYFRPNGKNGKGWQEREHERRDHPPHGRHPR